MTIHANTFLSSVHYRLNLAFRMALFFLVLLLFAGLGLIDTAICFLWPAWRSREDAARRVSDGLVRLITKTFPLALVVPCSWGRPYRILHLDHPRSLRPGEHDWVKFSIQNTCNEIWQSEGKHSCHVGVIAPLNESAFYVPGEREHPAQPAKLPKGTQIAPAETVSFQVPIRAPEKPGHYCESWGLLIEGRGWLPTLNALTIKIKVN